MTEKGDIPFSLRYLLVTRIRSGFRPAAELPVKPLCLTLILIQEDPPTGDGLLPFGCGKPCRRDYVPPAAKAFRNERPADHVSGIGGRANSLCLPADIIQKLLIAVAGVVSGELRIHRAQRLFGPSGYDLVAAGRFTAHSPFLQSRRPNQTKKTAAYNTSVFAPG